MSIVSIIFPNQLFEKNPCLRKDTKVMLVEEHLFFRQYKFHNRKLVFQRASMKFYDFGKYQDAIVQKENILHHCALSMLLNVGLLTPEQVLMRVLEFDGENENT